jgi:hypothetical protein
MGWDGMDLHSRRSLYHIVLGCSEGGGNEMDEIETCSDSAGKKIRGKTNKPRYTAYQFRWGNHPRTRETVIKHLSPSSFPFRYHLDPHSQPPSRLYIHPTSTTIPSNINWSHLSPSQSSHVNGYAGTTRNSESPISTSFHVSLGRQRLHFRLLTSHLYQNAQ